MFKPELFFKTFNKSDSKNHLSEYEKRLNCYSSYKTNLSIKPFRKGNFINQDETLFFVNIDKLTKLYEEILTNSCTIQLAVSKLPPFAVEPYFHQLILEWFISTSLEYNYININKF
ncbi:hypothetical protein M3641_01705 [Bacillus cereus]|uniref:hypothetical protein n=1 Tax=Bacillus cereus TaxID=1396 RepID=UPI00203FFDB7|nr:hypothetical protein [Bacillus cereus]MCM3325427.1 hypothetical protein [Bacillus cereus]